MSIELLAKQGRDRVYGGLAAIESARLRQMRDSSVRACFTRFDEARNRLEYVARIRGLEFINDAAARSVNATWYSLQRMEGGVIWLAFGGDSTANYQQLHQLALRKVRMLICIGNDNAALHQAFQTAVPIIKDADTIKAAVNAAYYSGFDNLKVLFSPSTRQGLSDECAGMIFRNEVNEL